MIVHDCDDDAPSVQYPDHMPERTVSDQEGDLDRFPERSDDDRRSASPSSPAATATADPWATVDLDPIRQLAKLSSTEQKLQVVLQVWDEVKTIQTRIPRRLRHTVAETVLPIVRCYEQHCQSDMHVFADRWGPNFRHTEFGFHLCPGPKWRRRRARRSGPMDMTACGFEFGTASAVDTVPMLATLAALPMREQLGEIRRVVDLAGGLRKSQLDRAAYDRLGTLKPVTQCLREHCGGDEDELLRRWRAKNPSGDVRLWWRNRKRTPSCCLPPRY